MQSLTRFLQLNFIPHSTDLALLIIRVWLGASLLALHGWGKLTGFGAMAPKFADPLGLGPTVSLGLAVFGEVVCAALLVIGLFTRSAALSLIILMAVAFFVVHGRALSGPASGELAFLYLAGFVTVFLAGGGAYSVDRKLGSKA